MIKFWDNNKTLTNIKYIFCVEANTPIIAITHWAKLYTFRIIIQIVTSFSTVSNHIERERTERKDNVKEGLREQESKRERDRKLGGVNCFTHTIIL